MRRLPIALLVALLLAGCGTATRTVGPTDGARLAPRSTALLVRADTSFDSPQWRALRSLLVLFPQGKALLERIEAAKRSLGAETDLVALGPELSGKAVVGLTQPRNPADLESLLSKERPPLVSELIENWRVIARDRETIDRFKQARTGGSLADSAAYAEATRGLPAAPLASVYADGSVLTRAIGRRLKTGTGPIPGLGRIGWLAGTVSAREHGFALDARIQGDEIEAMPFRAELPRQVPADVTLYVGFKGLDATLDELRRSPALTTLLGSNAKLIGGLLDDALGLFEGEGAFYVRPGPPAEYTLVLQVADPRAAADTLERLATLVAAVTQQVPERVAIGGVTAKKLTIRKVTLYYAVFAGKLVVTTAARGIGGLQETGSKLARSATWNQAKAAAEMPSETAGIVYAQLSRLRRLSGFPRVDLSQLGTALVYGSVDGSVLTLRGFVSVR